MYVKYVLVSRNVPAKQEKRKSLIVYEKKANASKKDKDVSVVDVQYTKNLTWKDIIFA